jgi:hypothetical protein
MPLPKITGVKQVAVQDTEAQQFDDAFIVSLSLMAPVDGRQPFSIRVRPYNYAAKAIYPTAECDADLAIEDIWGESARSATFAQLMGSICQVTSWLIRERQLLAVEKPRDDERKELETIRAYLGVTG